MKGKIPRLGFYSPNNRFWDMKVARKFQCFVILRHFMMEMLGICLEFSAESPFKQ